MVVMVVVVVVMVMVVVVVVVVVAWEPQLMKSIITTSQAPGSTPRWVWGCVGVCACVCVLLSVTVYGHVFASIQCVRAWRGC